MADLELSIAQLVKARKVILENATSLLSDSLFLINHHRIPRGYALAVLAREEMGKLTMTVRALYSIKDGQQVDWKRFHKRTTNHAEKLKVSALMWLLLSTSHAGKADPKGDLLHLLESPELRQVLNEAKQDGFYVGLSSYGITSPELEISEPAAHELYHHTRTLLEFFASGEETDPETSFFAGIQDLYGKFICLADDLVETPEQVALPR